VLKFKKNNSGAKRLKLEMFLVLTSSSRSSYVPIGQPVIAVDSCTFESGDQTSFSNARSNITRCYFQSVTNVGVHLAVQI